MAQPCKTSLLTAPPTLHSLTFQSIFMLVKANWPSHRAVFAITERIRRIV